MKEKTKINQNLARNNIKNNEKAITLIALVVTIIVLIILAGVSINLVLGNNGIITKAREARENFTKAAEEEQTTLDSLYAEMNSKIEGQGGSGGSGSGGNYDTPYIPNNFEHKAGTTEDWNAGYTIIGKAGTANAGDEFVWVPCVTDQSKVKSGDTVQTFGKHFSSKTQETDPRSDDAEHNAYMGADDESNISDKGPSAEAIRQSVATYGGFYIAKYEAGIEGTTDNYTKSQAAAGSGGGSSGGGGEAKLYTNKYQVASTNLKTVKKTRVAVIGTGGENFASATSTDGSVKPLSKPGVGVWNYITRAKAITVSNAMIPASTGAKSALISGACWDTTMQWIKQTTNTNYDIDSTGKGNYSGNYPENGLTTAPDSTYAINNIYDMAGNVAEWTTENYTQGSSTYLVDRGGRCFNSGSDHPAARRDYNFGGAGVSMGFRVVLYK